MKFFKVLLILLVLTGCDKVYDQTLRPYDVSDELNKVFTNTAKSTALVNNYSTYMDYYLPYELNEYSSDEISSVYLLNDGKLIMNINISGIINNEFKDEGFFDIDKIIYTYSGYYLDFNSNQEDFLFNVYKYDDEYILYFINKDLIFYAYTNKNDVLLMAQKIYDIAKSVSIDREIIVNTYSNNIEIDYQKTYVNLFKTTIPVSGRVEDLMIDTNTQTDD